MSGCKAQLGLCRSDDVAGCGLCYPHLRGHVAALRMELAMASTSATAARLRNALVNLVTVLTDVEAEAAAHWDVRDSWKGRTHRYEVRPAGHLRRPVEAGTIAPLGAYMAAWPDGGTGPAYAAPTSTEVLLLLAIDPLHLRQVQSDCQPAV